MRKRKKSKKRILLIEPPFYRFYHTAYSTAAFHLWMGYISSAIRDNTSWDVMAYNADFNPSGVQYYPVKVSHLTGSGFCDYLNRLTDKYDPIWQEIKSTIFDYMPDAIGITARSTTFVSTCMIADMAKTINPDISVIVGGPHVAVEEKYILDNPSIDFAINGEGELTIAELLYAIENQTPLNGIRGLLYKKGLDIIENEGRPLVGNLDSLSYPLKYASKVLKDYNKYPPHVFNRILATRGCPNNCIFCASELVWGRKVRFRTVENVLGEIGQMVAGGIKDIHFEDDTFGVNEKYTKDLCVGIAKEYPLLRWSCEMHVSLVKDEIIALMKKSGCCMIQLGIESGNDFVLKYIRKNITTKQALKACEIIKKHKIVLCGFFMFGFPCERENHIKDTIRLMKKSGCDIVIYSIFTPYPKTEAFELCKKKGLIKKERYMDFYNHQSPANYFCPDIPRKRFREILSKIEKTVDQNNWQYAKRLFLNLPEIAY